MKLKPSNGTCGANLGLSEIFRNTLAKTSYFVIEYQYRFMLLTDLIDLSKKC